KKAFYCAASFLVCVFKEITSHTTTKRDTEFYVERKIMNKDQRSTFMSIRLNNKQAKQ
ncbi:hypothetical protein P7K49_036674, partial [Saguinus oedipus]